MALDDNGKMRREEVVPASAVGATGSFDIVLRDSSGGGDDDESFAAMLETMEAGDEIAAKPGPNKMVDKGGVAPVTDIHCIVSGTGAVSALGMLREVR